MTSEFLNPTGVVYAQLDLDDGTGLSIGDTEEDGHGWDRLTVDIGELVDETPEHYGTPEGGYDVQTVANEIRGLLTAKLARRRMIPAHASC